MCGLSGSVNTTRFLVYSSDQARGGLETRLCILFASNPACCQDYAIRHFLRLLQPFQSLVISSCSWSIGRVYCLRQPSRSRLGPTKTQCWLKRKICAPWLAFSRVKGRSAAESFLPMAMITAMKRSIYEHIFCCGNMPSTCSY